MLGELGIGLVCVTAGSPYYNPHVQRPAFFPPSDGYPPPEDPLVGVARLLDVDRRAHRARTPSSVVGRLGLLVPPGVARPRRAGAGRAPAASTSVGLGRMVLSLPATCRPTCSPAAPLERAPLCRTFSDCTTAPRNGLVSGCYPLDPFYKDRPERAELVEAKRAAGAVGRAG